MEVISIRKYAILKGCTEGNVRAAIRTGKIKEGVKREDGKVKGIIIDVADQEWAENYNHDRIRNSSILSKLDLDSADVSVVVKSSKEIKNIDIQKKEEGSELVHENIQLLDDVTIFEAKRKEAIYKAQLLELSVLERKKELISANKVYKALFDFTSHASSAILSIPDRIIDDLIASKSRSDAYNLLSTALNDALKKLSNSKPKGL